MGGTRGVRSLAVVAIGVAAVLGSANPVGAWAHEVTFADGYFANLLEDNDGVATTPTEAWAVLYLQDGDGNLSAGYARSSLLTDTHSRVLDTKCEHPESIAADGTSVVAACSFGSTWDIWKQHLAVRRTTGGSWTARVEVQGSTRPAPNSASIAISGDLAVIGWTDYTTGGIWVARSTNGGTSFRRPVKLGTTSTLDIDPGSGRPRNGRVQVAVTGDRVYVAWLDGSSGSKATKRWPTRLRLRRSNDRGASFGSTATLVSGTELPGPPAMVATGSRVLILHATGRKQARALRSTDAGRTFRSTSLSERGKASGDLDLAMDGAEVRAIWRYGSRVYLRSSDDAGASWAARESTGVTRNSGQDASPNVVLLGSSTAVAFNDMGAWGGLGGQWVQATVAP